jgi:hypothetical protein
MQRRESAGSCEQRAMRPPDQGIENMSSEYTDIQHHSANRAGVVVSVRLRADEAQLLHAMADREGRTMSDTLRVALHSYSSRPPADRLESVDPPTRGGVLVVDESATFC